MKVIRIIICLFCFFNFAYTQNNDIQNAGLQKYYSNITKASKNEDWWSVIYFSKLLLNQYPHSSLTLDTVFSLAKAYYNVNELEVSNKFLSEYLNKEFSPKYYTEAITYKFNIAKKYMEGSKKRILGSRKMPKLLPAKDDALKLFDEVLNAMPNSEMAIESMFYKAKIHAFFDEHRDSVEAFRIVIRKYPKHELAIESFLEIGRVYLKQADPKNQDPNLLDLAEVNVKRFKEMFPKEERIKDSEKDFYKLQEVYAQGFYEIGSFYEKMKKKEAAKIYYNKIILSYPDTPSAKLSAKRLEKIN
jgi:outer membrane protein assembly factor BamD (BamD/ComL family)